MNKGKAITGTLFVIIIVSYFGLQAYADGIAREKVDAALTSLENFAKVEYDDVSVDLLSQNVHIADVRIFFEKSEPPLHIANVIIYHVDKESPIPTFLDIAANGIEISGEASGKKSPQSAQESFFTDKMNMGFRLSYIYHPDSNLLELKRLALDRQTVDGQDIGAGLDLSMRLGNLPELTNNPAGILLTYPQITLHHAEIHIAPQKKIMEIEAAKAGENADGQIKVLVEALNQQIELARSDNWRKVLLTVRESMTNPDKGLNIRIAPDKPVTVLRLMQLGDFGRMADELKLSAKN